MLTARADMPEVIDADSGQKVPNPLRGAGLNVRLMDDCMPMESVVADEETGTGPRLSTIMVLHDPLDDAAFEAAQRRMLSGVSKSKKGGR